MEFDCFIFDFDGTIAYTDRAYQAAYRYAIKLHTGKDIDDSVFSGSWGMNVTPEEVLLPHCGGGEISALLESFEEHYYENHHLMLSTYAGITEVLTELRNYRALVGIVSLKPRRAGERELAITGISSLIDASVWGDDVALRKPHPDGVHKLIASLRADASRAIVIGDSAADILMGRAAGVKTGAALWNGRESLREVDPDFEFRTPEEIISLLSQS